MISKRLRKRLKKDRPTTTISMQIPVDVLDSLKAIAPTRGFNAYQTPLKSYISDGLRRDEAPNPHVGSSFDDFLKEEGIFEETRNAAIRRVLAVAHRGDHEDQEAHQVSDGQSGGDKRRSARPPTRSR
jgi:hypothetical protein